MDDDGAEVLPNWVGLNPEEGEDSTKEIASSDEGEDDEEEDGEDVEPAGGTTGRPQADRASSNEARGSAPSTGGGDQAEVRQPAAPSAGRPSPPTSPARRSLRQLDLPSLSFLLVVF